MANVKRLFWDIETSPGIFYSWRCGYDIKLPPENMIREPAIICICFKWQGKDKVHSLVWNDGDDRDVVRKFAKVAAKADELVAHNGDRFDLRWFNGRNLVHGLPPVPQFKTVDTLKIARRYFYLPSAKLDYLAKRLFGEGKIKTEFELWKKVTGNPPEKDDLGATLALTRDPKALGFMVEYCKLDVVLVERAWAEMSSYATPRTHAGVQATGDTHMRWTCPACGSDNVQTSKTRTTGAGMIRREMKCNDCRRYYSIADNVHRWYLKAKYRDRDTVEGSAA